MIEDNQAIRIDKVKPSLKRGKKDDLAIRMAELPKNQNSASSAFLCEKGKEKMKARLYSALSIITVGF